MLFPQVWCAGAGTSADVEALVRRVKFDFWMRGVRAGEGLGGVGNADRGGVGERGPGGEDVGYCPAVAREDREVPPASVLAVLHRLRATLRAARGGLGVNLLAGGYDRLTRCACLAAVHPHGSVDVVTHAALGSGGLAATGVLEARYLAMGGAAYRAAEGVRLAVDAVRAGIQNDLGSGGQVDVCVIGREGILYRRAVAPEEELSWQSGGVDGDGREQKVAAPPKSAGGERECDTGVNGFGNMPFAIKSKRYVTRGQAEAKREQRRWLEAVIEGGRQSKP